MEYQHVRHLATFHDLHAVMALSAMANGVEDDAQAALWQSRTEAMLQSMKEYVRNRGVATSDNASSVSPPPPPTSNKTTEEDGAAGVADAGAIPVPSPGMSGADTPLNVVKLHSTARHFISREGFVANEAVSGEGGGRGEGGRKGVRSPPPDNLWVAEHVGLPLCEAMVAYREVRIVLLFFFFLLILLLLPRHSVITALRFPECVV